MNEHFIETVREEHLHDSGSVAEDVARIYSALMDTPILTHATHQAMLAWFDDLEKING
jgi:hypothetical protein